MAGIRASFALGPAGRLADSGACPGGAVVEGAGECAFVAAPSVVPGYRGRCQEPAGRDHGRGHHDHRARPRPHPGGPAAVLDSVLAAGAPQLPARPVQPGVPVGDRRYLRLLGGRALHRGGVAERTDDPLPATCRHGRDRAAVREPGGADLLPGPPGPLDPDRPADGGHRARDHPGHQAGAARRGPGFGAWPGACAAGMGK